MPDTDINTGTQTGEAGLSFGLNGITDWSTQMPFLDIFKTARPWTGHLEGQWGGLDDGDLSAAGVLDEDGWLREMPEGVTHVETFVLTELPAEATSAAGTYRLTYEGEGEITISGVSDITYGDGEIWFDYTPTGENLVGISIFSTDPEGTGDYLRDFSLVREDNIEAFEAGEVFNPVWLDKIDDVQGLRFMDWMETNNSEVVDWSDAPSVDDYTYAHGVPVEVMVELANQTGTEPWFNIPFGASEEYIETFATYVRDNLDPDLRAHFEYSNEVWNFMFQQAQASAQEGVERFGEDLPDGWMQNYGAGASEMADVLDEVYAGHEDALVKVIATHTGWPGLEESLLEAPAWQEMGNEAPYTQFDTYAVTGYFGASLGDSKADTVRSWIEDSQAAAEEAADGLGLEGEEHDAYLAEHQYDQATDLAIQELRDGSVTGDPSGSLAELSKAFEYHAGVAEAHDLSLVMYEGGTHVVGIGANANDEELSEFFQHLNYSDQMGDLYGELLESWEDAGGTLFNAFVDVAGSSQWGSWGSLRYLEDESARNDELQDFNDAHPRPWEDPEDAGDEEPPVDGGEEDPADPEGDDQDSDPEEPTDPEEPVDPEEPEEDPEEEPGDDMGDVDPDEPDMPEDPDAPDEPGGDEPEDAPEEEDDEDMGEVDPDEPDMPEEPEPDPEVPDDEDDYVPDLPPEDEDYDDGSGGGGGGGACFVATAAYTDPMHPDVCDLRRFRDEHLVNYAAGRAFVAFYWKVGPHMARHVRGRPRRAAFFRGILAPMVRQLRRHVLR